MVKNFKIFGRLGGSGIRLGKKKGRSAVNAAAVGNLLHAFIMEQIFAHWAETAR
jgi:hypothetical protein